MRAEKSFVLLLCLAVFGGAAAEATGSRWSRATDLGAPDENAIPLWPDGVPEAPGRRPNEKVTHRGDGIYDRGVSHVREPSLTPYLPAQSSAPTSAVVICPGGGYAGLAIDKEGHDVARWLNSAGVAGFVLKYRLPARRDGAGKSLVPLTDAQRALRMVRDRAAAWNVDPGRVGIMGFSAGGHLASTAATHFESAANDAADSLRAISCRPDFLVLVYPVVSMTESVTHAGSRERLIGKNPSPELVDRFSNERQVTATTPLTFLVHTNDDPVRVENSLLFYNALRDNKVPVEMHLFETGGHGYGLRDTGDPVNLWPQLCARWMAAQGLR